MENILAISGNRGIFDGMSDATSDAISGTIRITMDAAGRIVLPKAIRDHLGLDNGAVLELAVVDDAITLSPAPADVRLQWRGKVLVAEPVEAAPPLSTETVARVTRELRERRG